MLQAQYEMRKYGGCIIHLSRKYGEKWERSRKKWRLKKAGLPTRLLFDRKLTGKVN